MRSATEYIEAYKMLADKVIETRAKVAHNWPTPDQKDSVLYAITEAGEALDAYLRVKRSGDARNHERERSVGRELAPCLMMLLTAQPSFVDIDVSRTIRTVAGDLSNTDVDLVELALVNICFYVSVVLSDGWYRARNGYMAMVLDRLICSCAIMLMVACDWLDIDFEYELMQELAEIECKHGDHIQEAGLVVNCDFTGMAQ